MSGAAAAAGEEALGEIERLEAQLSFYRAESEINLLNRRAAQGAVRVSPPLFNLLSSCLRHNVETDGAFDVTIAPLMRAWRFVRDRGAIPSEEELAVARELTGSSHIILDEERFEITFDRPGVEIDLGGFAKGYAVERAIDLLRENGVRSALLHSGTSSIRSEEHTSELQSH